VAGAALDPSETKKCLLSTLWQCCRHFGQCALLCRSQDHSQAVHLHVALVTAQTDGSLQILKMTICFPAAHRLFVRPHLLQTIAYTGTVPVLSSPAAPMSSCTHVLNIGGGARLMHSRHRELLTPRTISVNTCNTSIIYCNNLCLLWVDRNNSLPGPSSSNRPKPICPRICPSP
jgi:hypothetical protein